MILAVTYKIPIDVSLGVIATLLALSIITSLLFPRHSTEAEFGAMTSQHALTVIYVAAEGAHRDTL